jgi:hypothetical protein
VERGASFGGIGGCLGTCSSCSRPLDRRSPLSPPPARHRRSRRPSLERPSHCRALGAMARRRSSISRRTRSGGSAVRLVTCGPLAAIGSPPPGSARRGGLVGAANVRADARVSEVRNRPLTFPRPCVVPASGAACARRRHCTPSPRARRSRRAAKSCLGRVTRWDAIMPRARFRASPVRPRGRGAHAKRPRRRLELPDCHRERAHRWQTPRLATGQRASVLPAAWLASALPSASASTRRLGRRSRRLGRAAGVRSARSAPASLLRLCGMQKPTRRLSSRHR